MLVLVPARLNREQLALLRQSATDNAQAQRRTLDQDLSVSAQTAPVQAVQAHPRRSYQTSSRSERAFTVADVATWEPRCPLCLMPLERAGRFLKCDNCEILLNRTHGIGLEMRYIGEELSLGEDDEAKREEVWAL
jgi:hypothetical protein